ncbi:tol-pal system protein YbgF [bacterium BMS3Bbin12]|nr:tol-pal system protein YbgF [bacterium BMS3Abin12]GBE47173.1 tol-pal system protein YbgF [bacterium BMS3Bbin12]GBE49572.1 tol-pal system protein YbgF [bacterium BMS3Bbin13]HDJ86665.1 tol-pal system protein YbgF [Chromatiales bacterium]HDK03081.1 tol-pal system protein YbgF [Gammaproteobacteria bacterium]
MTHRSPGIRGLRLVGPMLVVVVAALVPVGSASSAGLSLEQRVERLERIVNGPGMVDMLGQIQALQQQIQQLTGRQDELQHNLDNLQRHQRDLYLDIDQRLRRLELKPTAPGSAGAAPSSPIPAAPSPGGAGAAAGTATATLQVQSDYESALGLLRAGKYPQAAQAFRAFLKAHPDSAYADNAEYWLGETNYVTRNFGPALQAFQAVVRHYSRSPKVPDSLLKIGYIQYEQKHWKAARKTLTEVIARYPNSAAARLAEQRRQRMKVEGH